MPCTPSRRPRTVAVCNSGVSWRGRKLSPGLTSSGLARLRVDRNGIDSPVEFGAVFCRPDWLQYARSPGFKTTDFPSGSVSGVLTGGSAVKSSRATGRVLLGEAREGVHQ